MTCCRYRVQLPSVADDLNQFHFQSHGRESNHTTVTVTDVIQTEHLNNDVAFIYNQYILIEDVKVKIRNKTAVTRVINHI